jgi:hypothetical protein
MPGTYSMPQPPNARRFRLIWRKAYLARMQRSAHVVGYS